MLTILESIEKIFIYSSSFKNADELFYFEDQVRFNAIINLLMAIGEESKKVEEQLKQNYNQINWKAITALRNIIAHNYRGINKEFIWDIIKNRLLPLKECCVNIVKDVNPDKKALEKYISSEFYKHLIYLKE